MPSSVLAWPAEPVLLAPVSLRAVASSDALSALPVTEQSHWFSAPRLVSPSLRSKQYSYWACSEASPATPAFGQGSWPLSTVVLMCSWPGAFCSTPIQIGFWRARLSASATGYWYSLISCQRHIDLVLVPPLVATLLAPLMSLAPPGRVFCQSWFGPLPAVAGWPPVG